MNWNTHSNLKGRHALFSPSSYYWINYDPADSPDVIFQRYKSQYAATIGTLLHEYAEKRIRYGKRLETTVAAKKQAKSDIEIMLLESGIPMSVIDIDSQYENLLAYVNDGVGFRMEPEVILWYSDNFFGTADAIYFRNKELRIHDYKSGKIPAHMEQLEIYSALFCLEYSYKPSDISINLRLYQGDEIVEHSPEADAIGDIMKTIVDIDKLINKWKVGDNIA